MQERQRQVPLTGDLRGPREHGKQPPQRHAAAVLAAASAVCVHAVCACVAIRAAFNGRTGISHLHFMALLRERRLLHHLARPLLVGFNVDDLVALCKAPLA